jgi:hypothetical protein
MRGEDVISKLQRNADDTSNQHESLAITVLFAGAAFAAAAGWRRRLFSLHRTASQLDLHRRVK